MVFDCWLVGVFFYLSQDDFGDDRPVYKKVAVVEDFFDIIYREHVEFGGRATGKHAGQKRTYRAVSRTLWPSLGIRRIKEKKIKKKRA